MGLLFKRGTTANKPTLSNGEIYIDSTKKSITTKVGDEEFDAGAMKVYDAGDGITLTEATIYRLDGSLSSIEEFFIAKPIFKNQMIILDKDYRMWKFIGTQSPFFNFDIPLSNFEEINKKYSIWAGTISASEAGTNPTIVSNSVTIEELSIKTLAHLEGSTGGYYIIVDGVTNHSELTVVCNNIAIPYSAFRTINIIKGTNYGINAIHLDVRKFTVSGSDVVANTATNGFMASFLIIKKMTGLDSI